MEYNSSIEARFIGYKSYLVPYPPPFNLFRKEMIDGFINRRIDTIQFKLLGVYPVAKKFKNKWVFREVAFYEET